MTARAIMLALGIPLLLGMLLVAAASPIPSDPVRLASQLGGVTVAVSCAWLLSFRSAKTHSSDAASDTLLDSIARDRRVPGLDRHSGLQNPWYFFADAVEELDRARHFNEQMALISIHTSSKHVLDHARHAVSLGLRRFDVAGDLGDSLAVVLPHTGYAAAREHADVLCAAIAGAVVNVLVFPDDGDAVERALRADEFHFRPPLVPEAPAAIEAA